MLDDQHAPAALARLDGAHQARGAAADHNHVEPSHLIIENREARKDLPCRIFRRMPTLYSGPKG